jgi:hypothetical protein
MVSVLPHRSRYQTRPEANVSAEAAAIEALSVMTVCETASGFFSLAQVSAIACQVGPGLGLTGPPPAIVFPLISQIEAWPLVF